VPSEIELAGPLTVGDLASRLGLPAGEIVKRLLEQGALAGINQQISLERATKVAGSFGSSARRPAAATAQAPAAPPRPEVVRDPDAVPRSPVVTIMGHVDHGKTSLLDAIRKTEVAAHEFGGITQHIGASTISVDGRRIVFIDTPGHEAFTTLRARGAQVTDITVLVVAADDGVMPQTIEAINHAKAAGVSIIVAINKVDLPQANADRVKQQLAELGLMAEDWGGETVTIPVSARTGQGVKELLELILLVSELQELRANPARLARGTIIEAKLDKGRGPVATVLVQEGTLHVGDAIVAGHTYGRVRAMSDDRGERLAEASPATPAEVVGLNDMPEAGDLLEGVRDDRLAKAIAEERRERNRAAELAARPGRPEEVSAEAEGPKDLRVILKADVHGSVEALKASLERLATSEVGVSILHTGVGNVTESDVMLAVASRAIIIGFNIRPEPQVRRLAEQEQVEVLTHRIIYEAIDDLQARVRGMLAPKRREVSLGQAEVRQTFTISKVGTVAGCFVTAGVIQRAANVRVIRDGVVVFEGKFSSLRRFKEDVREVTEGFECGIAIERFGDVKVGDTLEAYEVREEPA
jgi:translation initiation factor IF-2